MSNIKKLLTKGVELIKGGLLHILTGNILNRAFSMISGVVVANFVDKIEYANISYADNIYSYIALLSGIGMSNAILRYCAIQKEKSMERAYMKYAFKCGGLFELGVSVLACIVMAVVDIPYPRARIYMWILVLYPMLSYFNTCLGCYMRTQLENKKYAINGVINSSVLCVASIVLVITIGTVGVMPARYIAIGVTLIYAFSYYGKHLKGIDAGKLSPEQKKAFWSMGVSLMIAQLFNGIMPINESFLVNNIIQDEITTSNFRVAGQFPQLLSLISSALTVYYFPLIAKMTDFRQIKNTGIKVGVLNAVIVGSVTGVAMLLTPFALNLLYGGKYNDAISISYVLWIMRATNGCFRAVPVSILAAIGKIKFNAGLAVCACIVQTILDYIFIKQYGVIGVAYGTIIVYAISAVLYWAYFINVCNKNINNGNPQSEIA